MGKRFTNETLKEITLSDPKVIFVPFGAKNQKVRRFAILDFAVVRFDSLLTTMKKGGVFCEAFTDVSKFLLRVKEESFDVCLVNLLVGGAGPFEFIEKIRSLSMNHDLKIIVISKQVHKINIQHSIEAGANDFVGDPFEQESLYARILYHLTPKTEVNSQRTETAFSGNLSREYVDLLLSATELLSHTERGNEHKAFFNVLQQLALLLNSNRSSLVIVDETNESGMVLASSDNPNFFDFPVALHKYPEILHVINTGNIVLIEDVSQNVMTQKIKEKVKEIEIGSLMVFPIRFQSSIVGVLQLRRSKATELPTMDVLRTIQCIANMLAAHASLRAFLRRIYKDYAVK